jgi:hypothetical protein
MALETLKGLTEIGGEKIVIMDDLRTQFPDKFNESGAMDYEWFESEIRPRNYMYAMHYLYMSAAALQVRKYRLVD